MPAPQQDIKKLLAEAKLPRRIVSVCTRGDLTAEAQRIEDQLRETDSAPERGSGRLSGPSESVRLASELGRVREQMRESSIEFELTAFPSTRWRALKAEHPVKANGSQADAVVGADTQGLFTAAVRPSIVGPVLDDEDWERLMEALPDGEWQKLIDAVYMLNEEGTQLPFSSRAFGILQAQSDDSESPEASESHPAS